jgi:3-hydroxybutyryl-CoA dehydrogenase
MTAMDVVDVVGAGRIGHGIAACVAANGYRVRLRDLKERQAGEEMKALERARELITRSLTLLAEEGLLKENLETVLERVEFVRGMEGLDEAFHVVEALPEDMEVKSKLLPKISKEMAEKAVLASTSSSIRPSHMAAYVKTLKGSWLRTG